MPSHRETRVFAYSVEQVFNLVADVERYPEFLPWCIACRIKSRETPESFTADLAVGFKMVREKFSSRVTINRPTAITVTYLDGPFEYLTNSWAFRPTADGRGTEIEFHLDFEFGSRLLRNLIGFLFEEAVKRMVSAFEKRAIEVYGPAA